MRKIESNFGERVVRLWYSLGGRAKLARLLDVPESEVTKWEKLKSAPNREVQDKINRLTKRAAQAESAKIERDKKVWKGDAIGGRRWLNEVVPRRIFPADLGKGKQ